MATKIKKNGKISVGDLEKAVKGNYQNAATFEWNGITISIQRTLGISEMMAFMENVVKACFDTNAVYHPEMKDFATRIAIVSLYTNLSLPSGLSRIYDIVYGSDIVDAIYDHVNQRQLDTILSSIDEKVSQIIHSNIEAINKQIHSMNNSLEQLGEQFSGLFDGVAPEDIQNVMKAVGDGGLDENKLMQAYLNAAKTGEGVEE